ncbi:MAG TPA: ferritin-like domain-containing protein [Actinophytocola sp.]|uniref:ferritin-like domain-containing protein n=1 Tax=Actinophytocola sp. TaxID=1872138 RepID=UPI002DDD0288|nr:ferritin-like domain-containing protein [Actinophytocola sp.]HEV2783315.1 ferritin-like domain-containing protein [Actinophytocola sp.]
MTGQPPSSSAAPLPGDALEAVQQALGAEHAAVWVYGLVSAFLPASFGAATQEGMTAHRARRDATERLLAAAGTTPRPAEPAYLPPRPVTDQASAIAVLITAESDATVAWRAVLERTDDGEVRRAALEALTAAAVRATRWRKAGGQAPVAPALPGQPA